METVSKLLKRALQKQRLGQFEAAKVIAEEVLSHDPNCVDALHCAGMSAHFSGDRCSALARVRRASTLMPDRGDILTDLGFLLERDGRFGEALACHEKARDELPDSATVHNNLGSALHKLGELDAAADSYRRATALNFDCADAHCNLGHLSRELGRIDESIRHYNRAIIADPQHADARASRGLAHLCQGHLDKGWEEYDWRLLVPGVFNPYRLFPWPIWQGSDLDGKSVLVLREQGIGDEVMFSSCIPHLLEKAASCVILCAPRLVPIFARSFPRAKIVGCSYSEDQLQAIQANAVDFQIAGGSLPRYFRRDLQAFQSQGRYLIPNERIAKQCRNRLDQLGPGLKIGIAWRGSGRADHQTRRRIPAATWRPLLDCSNVHFLNLQHGATPDEIEAFARECGTHITSWTDFDPLVDLESTLAALAALDLVVSIDNTTVHLAGGLGLPVWNLVPLVTTSRWAETADTSRWYPSMRLIRQTDRNDWTGPLRRAGSALSRLCSDRR